MKFFKIIVVAFVFLPFQLLAQVKEQSGWFAFINSTRINAKWGLHLDVQVRSADEWKYVKNAMFRPGITYYLNTRSNVTAGYAWIETFANPDLDNVKNLAEHRIWEQYILSYKINKTAIMHRFRVEQRFIERPLEDVFSQRLRYFARAVIPLKADSSFNKGMFVALQNEVFLNLQNKNKLNNKVFDQNRLYLAAGYRLNKKMDLEAGYLHHYIDGLNSNTTNHVVQLALYTRF